PEALGLVRALRARVADQLSAQVEEAERSGRGPIHTADERQLARRLIADALVAERRRRLNDASPLLEETAEDHVAQAVFDALFGLGRLQPLLNDPEVTDVHVNGCDSVHVRRRDGTRLEVDAVAESDEELIELIRMAAARFGRTERRFDAAAPELNLQLPDGSRMFAVMEVSGRPSVAIRLHHHQKVTLADLRGLDMFDQALEAFLAAAVFSRQNLIIGGPWNVGKTTLLRALVHLLSPEERIVTVEDALELGFDRFPELHRDVVTLEERRPNIEGAGAVTLADEVRWGLRMDPDRLIVGEVRGDEVLPMLNAMSHGNDGSLCTIHADSSRGVFEKLVLYALQTPQRLDREVTNILVANAIDLVVFVERDHNRHRHVASVREVTGTEGPVVSTNEVFAPGPDGRARPSGRGRITDRRLHALVDAGFDPAWLDRGAR
ncbi:MAG: CpaF family protein, partial [Acidimicrobiia bacterium]